MTGTILIVDDVETNRIVLKVKLAAACYQTLQAADGISALAIARRAQPDLILLDVQLPDLSGIEVCRQLRAERETRDIPVIMVTSAHDRAARRAALRAGADDFLSKPVDEAMLMARMRSLLRARETEAELRLRDDTSREMGFAEPGPEWQAPGTIALVAADAGTAAGWRTALAPHLSDRLVVVPHETALAETSSAPDVYLIAADLAARGDGLRLMSELRSRVPTRHSAVCILLPEAAGRSGDLAAMAFDLGANDLLLADFDPEETALRLAAQLRRKRQADRLRALLRDGLRLALTDPLTGLYNRRYALPHLARMAERARQTGRRYAVMLLDLDRFKAVNDSYGHAAGDAVLAEVAQRLLSSLRAVDLVARIGGEEFLVAMPEATLATARATAERLCRVVQAVPVALPEPALVGAGADQVRAVTVTVSIGLALGGPDPLDPRAAGEAAESVMARADAALLVAKAEGRNQVTVGRNAA
jgi:two-component system cell cycle response regulator